MHSCRVSLHDSGLGINVDNQSGKVVTFTVYETVGVVRRIRSNTDAAAHVVCYFQLTFPEIVVDRFLTEREHTHSDTSDLEMSFGDKFFFRGVYFYDFTFFGISVETGDSTGENPGVKSFERLFFAGFEVYFMHDVLFI